MGIYLIASTRYLNVAVTSCSVFVALIEVSESFDFFLAFECDDCCDYRECGGNDAKHNFEHFHVILLFL